MGLHIYRHIKVEIGGSMLSLILSVTLLAIQDVPIEKVVITIPDFCLGIPQNSNFAQFQMRPSPMDSHRHYFLKVYDSKDGQLLLESTQYEEPVLREILEKALVYGVKDTDILDLPRLNPLYRDFIRDLRRYDMLNLDEAKKLVLKYMESNWVESLYWLDESFPGAVTKDQWEESLKGTSNSSSAFYFAILAKIKLSFIETGSVKAASSWADAGLLNPNSLYTERGAMNVTFAAACKGYAELVRQGAELSEESELNLLSLYQADDMSVLVAVREFFREWGMDLPRRNAVVGFLRQRVIRNDNVSAEIVSSFREHRVPFPKEKAGVYLEKLLQNFGERGRFEDIEYLLPLAKLEETSLLLLKSYGDSAVDWHFNTESEHRRRDHGDYIHAAVECYRIVLPYLEAAKKSGNAALAKRLELSANNAEKLRELSDNLEVRLLDIARIYEITGMDPRLQQTEFVKAKLERRALLAEDNPTGAYDKGVIQWHADKAGRPIILFRDDLEFALYFGDHQLLKKTYAKILNRANNQLVMEGAALLRDYANIRCSEAADFGETKKFFLSDNSAAYANLDAVADFLVKENNVDAIRIFARYLYDAGFVARARSLFHLGGLGKEMEEAFYENFPDKFWEDHESRFRMDVRMNGYIFD